MKVLFLDIDGVLNSDRYDEERDRSALSNIDETRLPYLKEIVENTGAAIVLSSSWRRHWDRDAQKCDESGTYITALFEKYGLQIYGKTEDFGQGAVRGKEIGAWLAENGAEAFAILDDSALGWGELTQYVVKTNPRTGRGLEREQTERAIRLLKGEG